MVYRTSVRRNDDAQSPNARHKKKQNAKHSSQLHQHNLWKNILTLKHLNRCINTPFGNSIALRF
jgi:hypothetical protein